MNGTCVVTGGSRGIGRAVAVRMAAEGYEVVATGRDRKALAETVKAGGGSVTSEVLDVTDEAAVEDFFDGRAVDVLVNNAGVAPSAPLERTSLEAWDATMRVNATGAFLCTRAVVGGMKERNRGRIIAVASVASHVGARYIAAYVSSKHAVLGLMRAVAAEVAGTDVTANSVCPAYVDTPMTDASVERIGKLTGMEADSARDRLARSVPLGRLLAPEEVAHVVAFFAHPESGAINGQSIVLDGGGVQL